MSAPLWLICESVPPIMKEKKIPISVLTAYDYTTAMLLDQAITYV